MFQQHQDLLTDTLKILHNIGVGKPNHRNAKILQMVRSPCIILHGGSFAMLGTVQLHCELRFVAEKIQDIASNDLLSTEAGGQ